MAGMIRNLATCRFVRIGDPRALADAVRVQAAARGEEAGDRHTQPERAA